MRKIVSHLIVTLDGVDVFDAVAHVIVKLRDTEEVLADFFAKLAVEDAMLLGHVTYREWAEHSPSITDQPFARHALSNDPAATSVSTAAPHLLIPYCRRIFSTNYAWKSIRWSRAPAHA